MGYAVQSTTDRCDRRGALLLAACGGSDDNTGGGGSGGVDNENLANTGSGQDPTREGPVTIDGAQPGGTVNVMVNAGFTTTLDPTEIYYTDTASIMSSLVTRSLTQYVYDPDSKQMILVPDLATDLGRPNDDYTEWTFTLRDGVKWEDGSDVTVDQLVFGIARSFDREAFPTGADYSNQYFEGGDTYKGPYTDKGNDKAFTAVTADGNDITIKMSKPFPDMPYWGAFPAMGPIPLDADKTDYALAPQSTGPYKIEKLDPAKELVLVKNENWDPNTDPGRTQYPDSYDFKSQQDPTKIDQIILGDTGDGQTTLTYDNLLAPDYNTLSKDDPDRIVTGGQPCTIYAAPDYRKVTDIKVRQALTFAYPYKNVILASGDIPDVTVIPATNLFPPGLPGRTEYNVLDHGDFETDAAKSQALLKEAGEEGYEIKFLFAADDEIGTKVKDEVVKGLEAGGFKATPVASSLADFAADRADVKKDINLRTGGWCSDWPSGSSWIPPVLGSTNPDESGTFGSNLAAFSEPEVDQKIEDIQLLPIDEQPAAWDALDKEIAEKYYPLVPRWYGGVVMAHGSKIQGMVDDAVFGMPTWKDIYIGE